MPQSLTCIYLPDVGKYTTHNATESNMYLFTWCSKYTTHNATESNE